MGSKKFLKNDEDCRRFQSQKSETGVDKVSDRPFSSTYALVDSHLAQENELSFFLMKSSLCRSLDR